MGDIVQIRDVIEVPPLEEMSLDELAAFANRAHEEAQQAVDEAVGRLSDALRYGVRCGQALLAAKAKVPSGEWTDWVATKTQFTEPLAQKYVRWGYYADEILKADRPLSTWTVVEYLRGLPAVPRHPHHSARPPETIAEVLRLHKLGLTPRAIAELVDMSESSVRYHVQPAKKAHKAAMQKRRRREISAAKKALERQRQDADIKKLGGSAAKAYEYVRKLASELDAALSGSPSPEQRETLRAALTAAHKCEDAIVRASRSAS